MRSRWRVFRVLLTVYLVLYSLAVVALFAVPHRFHHEGLSRMNAFQFFASVGAVASFGLLDLTLADWYYAPVERYDKGMRADVLVLTPVFAAWGFIIAGVGHFVAAGVVKSRRGRGA